MANHNLFSLTGLAASIQFLSYTSLQLLLEPYASDVFLIFSFHISSGCHFAFVLPLLDWLFQENADFGLSPASLMDFFQRHPAP